MKKMMFFRSQFCSYSDILEKYTEFLRGCGFVFNGQVDIVSDEDYYGLDDHVELTDLGEMCLEEVEKHSPHYFDTERNK